MAQAVIHERQGRRELVLRPGDYFVGDERHRVRTLLGSCVSIVLWHPPRRIGAISHFLLARRGGEEIREAAHGGEAPLDGRYGDEAMLLMAAGLRRFGIALAECQGKVFGGGDMFPGYARSGAEGPHVGQKNGMAARALLRAAGVSIVAESLFGDGYRQIIFDVRSGDVWAHQEHPAKGATS